VVTGAGIDAYTELDVRVGWRASEQWDLALVGQNLLDDGHAEFGPLESRGEIERSVLLKATWRN
jgi:iron complex outermembrane receptor protein